MVVVIGVRVTPLARRNVLDVTRRSDWGREMRGEVSDALHHSTTPPLHHSGLQHQKTPSSQPRLLSRALISPFTLGAVLIVFRVRKSRRGYERNETRGIVPRHNIVTSSLPTSQRATANFKSQHKNILHCWKLPTMGRAGQNIVSLNL